MCIATVYISLYKMGRLLRFAFVLLIADSPMVNFRVLARGMASVAKSFADHAVVPDVVPVAPTALLKVSVRNLKRKTVL